MNADRFKYKEITDIILRSFYEAYNELGDGFSVMISVDRWLNSYNIIEGRFSTWPVCQISRNIFLQFF